MVRSFVLGLELSGVNSLIIFRALRVQFPHKITYTVRQKSAPFYFCNNFVKSFYIGVIIAIHTYRNKFVQNYTRIINLISRVFYTAL